MKSLFLVISMIPIWVVPVYALPSRENDCFFDTGYAFYMRGEYDKALAEFSRFITKEKESSSPRMDKMAMMYRFQASCLDNLCLYPMAVNAMQDAITAGEILKDTATTVICLEQMAVFFRKQGKPSQAVLFLEEALAYYKTSGWLSRIQETYIELGRLYFHMGDYLTSERYLHLATSVRSDSPFSFEQTYIEDEVCLLQGLMHARSGKMKEAEKMLMKADSFSAIYVKALPDKASISVKIQLAIAELYRINGNIAKASAAADKARRKCLNPLVKWMRPLVSMEFARLSESIGDNQALAHHMTSLIDSLESQAGVSDPARFEIAKELWTEMIRYMDTEFEKTGNISFLIRNLRFLEKLHEKYFPDEFSFPFFTDFAWKSEDYGKLTGEMTRTAVRLYRVTHDKNYLKKAFYYSELGYLSMLKGNFQNSMELSSGEIEKDLIKLAGLKNQINRLVAGHIPNVDLPAGEKKKMVKLVRESEKIRDRIVNKKNTRFLVGSHFDESMADRLQTSLDPDETYLKFTDAGGQIFVFLVNREDFDMKILEKDTAYMKDLQLYNDYNRHFPPEMYSTGAIQQYVDASCRLYEFLMEPFDSLIQGKELIIEANGMLHMASFEALVTELPRSPVLSLRGLPYLIHDYTIRSSNSCALFLKSADRKKQNYKERYAGFAPFGKDTDNGGLPGSGLEIKTIGRIMDGKAILGNAVTKKAIHREAAKSAILHIATHALVNAFYPQLTELALNSDPNSPDEESRLFYFEILREPFDQQLVVLGACGSSDGKYVGGYGTVSLANAFMASGAGGVVAARWQVDDFASAKITIPFSQLIRNGEPFHHSLRKAKLALLADSPENLQHPHYWAVYSYFGGNRNLEPAKNPFSLIWMVVAVSFFIPGYFLLKRFYLRLK